jgi:signal peptidase II
VSQQRSKGTSVVFSATIFVLLLIIDQLVKAWVRKTFVVGEAPGYPIPGFFEITLTYNQGIAFGLFQGLGVLFAPIAVVISFMALGFCQKHPQEPRITHLALGLLASGAIGNLIDRVWLHRVTDMFWVRFIHFPVFNVADACITVGAILLGIRFVFEARFAPKPILQDTPSETPHVAEQ